MHYGEHWASNQTVHITFSIARGKLKNIWLSLNCNCKYMSLYLKHMRKVFDQSSFFFSNIPRILEKKLVTRIAKALWNSNWLFLLFLTQCHQDRQLPYSTSINNSPISRMGLWSDGRSVQWDACVTPFCDFFFQKFQGTRTRAHSVVLYVSRALEAREPPNLFFVCVRTHTLLCQCWVCGLCASSCTQ
jgi:hypothetical protein